MEGALTTPQQFELCICLRSAERNYPSILEWHHELQNASSPGATQALSFALVSPEASDMGEKHQKEEVTIDKMNPHELTGDLTWLEKKTVLSRLAHDGL